MKKTKENESAPAKAGMVRVNLWIGKKLHDTIRRCAENDYRNIRQETVAILNAGLKAMGIEYDGTEVAQ